MEDKEFDIKVRSLLENAEEEAPSYLIDDIFAELDSKKSRRRAAIIWWRRAGVISAVAAAVVLGVFLFRKNGQLGPDERLVADERPEVEVDVLAVAKDHHVAGLMSSLDSQSVADSDNLVAMAEVSEPQEIQEVSEVQELSEAEEIPSEVDEQAVKVTQTVNDDVKSDSFVDPFSLMEDEDEGRKRDRVAMVVNGNVSSNANPAASSSTGRLLTHGKGEIATTSIKQTSKESSYSIPVSFGLGVKINLTDRWAIGTGVNYTRLSRTFYGTYTEAKNGRLVKTVNSDVRNTLHYMGIPVNVFYNIVNSRRVNFYAYAGGTIEKGLTSRFTVKSSPRNYYYSESINGVQLSAGGGIGVEFKLIDELSLYIDPGVTYYFDGDQPMSIRTQQPFMMNFEVGLRVLL